MLYFITLFYEREPVFYERNKAYKKAKRYSGHKVCAVFRVGGNHSVFILQFHSRKKEMGDWAAGEFVPAL